jgi:hypothetical protein
MNDETLHRRILDAVLADRDPAELERELAHDRGMKEEYQRLRAAWEELRMLQAHEPSRLSREHARRAVLDALGPRAVTRRWVPRPAASAAAVAIFLAGLATGHWVRAPVGSIPGVSDPALVEGDEEPRWVLLIREGDAPEGGEQAEVEAMTEWARLLWSRDRLVWAERLLSESVVRVGDDAEGEVGGLFVIRARDEEEALRFARESPHLAWGGSVDVLPTATVAGR